MSLLDFPRWKVWLIALTLLVGVSYSIPSFLPEPVFNRLPSALQMKVNLGLDLAGGSRMVLEASPEEVAKISLQNMEDQIKAALRRTDNGPRIAIGDISASDGRLSFMVRDGKQVDAAVERIRPLTQGAALTGQRDFNVEVRNSTEIVITPTQAGIAAALDNAMKVLRDVIEKRIDALGTREPTIQKQGSNRIVVEVPGLQDPQELKALLGQMAKLEFKLVDTTANPAAPPIGTEVLPMADGGAPIVVRREVMVRGDDLVNAQQSFDQQTNEPDIVITFDAAGGRRFGIVTQQNVNKPFAIILDGKVLSAPNINEPILGGTAQIKGSFTVQSATQLAIQLRSGQMPVKPEVVEERTVGPQLGADSIRAGIIASIVAVVAVVIFMLITYGRFGVYANLAVTINVFVILGVMGIMNATLTLPGIAGFVLTIGTAVDANVLINERIREERRRGRSVVQSVEHGYGEASRTIFEANITHAIAGGIMLMLGTGPVRGFATVLLIGIATSVFTAVVFTRLLVSRYLRAKRPSELHI